MATGRHDSAPGLNAIREQTSVPHRVVAHSRPRPRPAGICLAGAVLGVGGFALGPHNALVLLAAPTTFAMPVIAAIADWSAGVQRRGALGIAVNLAAIGVLALALTLVAEAVAGHITPAELFSQRSGGGQIDTFPYLIPLGATTYVSFLQLSVVSEGRRRGPQGLGRRAGPLAILACLALAVIVYLTLTNWHDVPASTRTAMGLRHTGGPLPALDVVTWLIAVTGWQAMTNLLDGWPLSQLTSSPARITATNLAVVALGTGTYVLARVLLQVSPGELSAAAAMFAAGTSVMKGLLAGWPVDDHRPALRRVWLLGGSLALAAAGDVGLRALALAVGPGFTPQAPVQLWLVVCGLNLVSGGVLIAGPICGLSPTRRPQPGDLG